LTDTVYVYFASFVLLVERTNGGGSRIHSWIDTSRVARLGEMVPIGLLLTAVGTLKFGFGALRLFESLAGAHFEQVKAGFCWILL